MLSPFEPPPRPDPGSTIAVFSASSATQTRYPGRVRRAAAALGDLLDRPVRLMPEEPFHGIIAGSPQARAAALYELLADPTVGMIMFSVGGFNANDLLGAMAEWDVVPRKPLVGYSDSTAILAAYQKLTRSIVFYGPAAMPQFGEWPRPFQESVDSLVATVFDGCPRKWAWPTWYTQSTTDWVVEDEVERVPFGESRPLVMRSGTGKGILLGGNIPTLNRLAGTPWAPWMNEPTVLAIEGTADAAQPESLRAWLRHLQLVGALDAVTAVLIGRTPHDADRPRRMADLGAMVCDLFAAPVPIVADLPFGHTDPIVTLPLGAPVEVHADENGCTVTTLAPTTTPTRAITESAT